MDRLNNLKSILISNTRPYSDSNSIAADLAGIIARKGKRVALIDADLRHPYMHKVFGIPNHNGLVDILAGKLPVSKAIQQVKQKNISVITAGCLPEDASDPLNSRRMKDLIKQLKRGFKKVIIHGPAFSYLEASSLAGMVDGLVLLIHPGHVKTQMYQAIVDRFQINDTKIVGIVMRDQPKHNNSQSVFINRLLTFDRQTRQSY